jgi:hypothetical protein
MTDIIKKREALEKAYDFIQEAADQLIIAGEDDIHRKMNKLFFEIEDALFDTHNPKADSFDMAKYAEKLVMWR